MNKIRISANSDNLYKVLEFIDEELEKAQCSLKVKRQMDIAVEEIFVNIAYYAYCPGVGDVTIEAEVNNNELTVIFTDSGKKFNPLEKEDPDVSLSCEERKVGGLGVYIVKDSMDEMTYEYKHNHNVLKLKKTLS